MKLEGLKYVGPGWLVGVPARDLNAAEVERYGGEEQLLASGVYVKAESKRMEIKPENKLVRRDDGENKEQ